MGDRAHIPSICPRPREYETPRRRDIPCTFTGMVSGEGGQSFTDKACVKGTDSNGNPVSGCDTASVTIQDVTPTAAVTKTVQGAACAVVRYGVTVENTDAVDPLTLSALNDDQFGDITKDKNSTPVAKVDLRGGAQPPLHDEAPVRRHVDRHGSSTPTRQADDPAPS